MLQQDQEKYDVPAVLLRRAIGLFGLCLFGYTWRLWTPQTEFPQIPFFGFLVDTPGAFDWITFALVIGGLLAMTILKPEGRVVRAAKIVFLCGLTGSMLLDQHRLQPWAYQFWILTFLMLTLDSRRWLMAARILTISIYLYSAVSKYDYQFVHTVGHDMAEAMAWFWGRNPGQVVLDSWAFGSALVGVELAAGLLLLVPVRFVRIIALTVALAMHVSLLLILGPMGLNHYCPVLIWNLFFIVQLLLLFSDLPNWLRKKTSNEKRDESAMPGALPMAPRLGWAALIFFVAFPMTSYVGIADHWPAWELYSPRSSRVSMDLSQPVEMVTGNGDAGREYWNASREVNWNQWSLGTLGVPAYPAARFQVGCSLAVKEAFDEIDGISISSISVQAVSDRLTGERVTIEISPNAAPPNRLQDHAGIYWLNCKPNSRFRFGPRSSTNEHE